MVKPHSTNVDAFDTSSSVMKYQNEHERLKLLLDFTNSTASNLKLKELLSALPASVRNIMKCDSVWIHLPDMEVKKLQTIIRDFPEQEGFFDDTAMPIESSVVGDVFQKGKPLFVDSKDATALFPEEHRRVLAVGLKFGCLLPLVRRNHVLGVLSLARRADESFQGEADFLLQIANQLAIAVENTLAYEKIAALKEKLAQEKLYLENEIQTEMAFEEIIGQSPSLVHLLQQVQTVALTDSTVLILGETGTGKELIARAIHHHSRRKDRTFVKLNCAAIPTGLLESELFGHEKGAFTGAISQRMGRLELADQGSLFLNEVGDIPLELRSKLLRALQEREFERLGSSKTRRVDARLIAATNRDLQRMVADHEFRSDLYYRLNVFPIRVLPLRERTEDIPPLVRHFAQKYARRMEKKIETIPATVMKRLIRWQWPGNIRELENFIERAVILTRGNVLNIPLSELTEVAIKVKSVHGESYEREEIVQILKETRGRVGGPAGAANRLGIKRTTLLARMKRLGINPHRFA